MIQITNNVAIPEDELVFTASRSGGPGGQNVNKVSTRVTLSFDVANSPSLSEYQKGLILSRLKSRINREGILQVVSQETRSQAENREAATTRFVEFLREALRPRPVRRKTKLPRSAKEKRLKEKKHRGMVKRDRSKSISDE